MKLILLIALLLSASLVSCLGYWYILIDWARNVMMSSHQRDYTKCIGETVALGGYIYLAIRFTCHKLLR